MEYWNDICGMEANGSLVHAGRAGFLSQGLYRALAQTGRQEH
jgi:hypothetical protein